MTIIPKSSLDTISKLFQSSSITSKTIKNYDYHWRVFSDFCDIYNESPVPVAPETLVRYAVYLIVQRNCCDRTVRNHLSSIRRYHRLYCNITIPTPSQYFPLEAVLKGGSKYLSRPVQQKYPVTANVLAALTATLPDDSPFRTLYNVLFFGLPRLGNLLPYKVSKFSSIRHLTWDKISSYHDGVIITLSVTKTIQNFERLLRIPIANSPNQREFCVSTGLSKMKLLDRYPCGPKDPVFSYYEHGKWSPMTKGRFQLK